MNKKNKNLKLMYLVFPTILIFLFIIPESSAANTLKDARSMNIQAVQLYEQGRYREAIPIFQQALKIREKKLGPKHPDVADNLINLARMYTELGYYSGAESLEMRALKIWEGILGPEHPLVADSLNNLGSLYFYIGNYSKAESLFKRALLIDEKTLGPDHPSVTSSLHNLAILYSQTGDYSKAESLFKRAILIKKKTRGPEHLSVATSIDAMGVMYENLGNYQESETLKNHALKIREKVLGKDHPDVANSINNLATLYSYLGEYSKAESLFKRALLIKEKALGDFSKLHKDIAAVQLNLASLLFEKGDIDGAFEIFKKNDSLKGMGRYYLEKRQYKKAEKEYQEALSVAIKTGVKDDIVSSHIGIGFSYEGMGDYTTAKNNFKSAIDIIEDQWKDLNLTNRKTFLATEISLFTRLQAYEGMVRVIIKEKMDDYPKRSLLVAERVKSRTLLELLATKSAKGKNKNDQKIFAIDRDFQQKITKIRDRLSAHKNFGIMFSKNEKENLEKALNQALKDYEQFINQVKLQQAELASLITVEDISIEKIQSLLDSFTTIVEYFVTDEYTYVWLITRENISVHELDLGKNRILTMVNDFLLPNFTNRSIRPEPIITLPPGKYIDGETSSQKREENRQNFLKTAEIFYNLLLKPVVNKIQTNKLVIVPHGSLHRVPFAALSDGKIFLVEKYEITLAPSSSVIIYIDKKRNENKGRFLAFANPETNYMPLDFAEEEVNKVSSLFTLKEVFYRKTATESTVKDRSNFFDIIHFALHGEFNDRQPMQSGLLLSKDEKNDGYLQVHEIFGLNLKNANLVTLSACETGLSKIYGGDDLVGLSRAFIYAGTPSLIATLWQVDDRSTSILMKEFYTNWQKKGLTKPEALRQAQVRLKSIPEYRHPFYWAPFVMIGDWM